MSLTLGLSLAGGLIFILLLALWFAYRKGQNSAEGKQAKKGIDNARTRIEVEADLSHLSPADRERLLNRRD